jgi:eukaryotic-like serine/threonine-protein kinase
VQRWVEAMAVFDELVTLDADSRSSALADLRARDATLYALVAELLSADADVDERLVAMDDVLGAVARSDSGLDMDPLRLVGTTVSHFRVLGILARGGMGVVYRAEDLRLARAIALKFPNTVVDFDRTAQARFLQEMRLAGAIDHPNVCPVYEAGETEDGRLFYAMPLYHGETLKDLLARSSPLSIDVARSIAMQIVAGLRAAHRVGIIHRDLKPANVMILSDGTAKILDFGIARTSEQQLTASSTRPGTVAYMAPEQVLGHRLDERTDLWALGVVLYEMFAGRRPFAAGSDVAATHAIVHDQPRRPALLRTDVPPAIDGLVMQLLTKDPSLRPSSAEEVMRSLEGLRAPVIAARSRESSHRVMSQVASFAALAFAAWVQESHSRSPPTVRAVSVLSFDDAGVDLDRKYVAPGLAASIRDELSSLRGLAVSSETTRTHEMPSGWAVVRGRVRPQDGALSIDVRLHDARSGRELWTRTYDRTMETFADVERDVVLGVARALRAQLTRSERLALERAPTTNARAYDLYLRGRASELSGRDPALFGLRRVEGIRQAQSLYSRARDLDPSFARARGRLALVLMYGAAAYDTTPARREQARVEAEVSLRLRPHLVEPHQAMASYWGWRALDPARAIEELRTAIGIAPHRSDLRLQLGNLYRQTGRWDDALVEYDAAIRFDPTSPAPVAESAVTLLRLRRDEDAMRRFDRLIALIPDDHMVKVIRGHTYLRWLGTPDTLAAVMQRVPNDWDPNGMATWARFTALWVQGRHDELFAMLNATRAQLCRDGLVYQPIALMRARAYDTSGDQENARRQYALARALLEDSVAARPDDPSRRVAFALSLAGLGRVREAGDEARRAMVLAPLSRSHQNATAVMGVAIEAFARAGDLDTAFELAELLLSLPAGREVTVAFLRVWPGFVPMRGDPRFGPLLARFSVQ